MGASPKLSVSLPADLLTAVRAAAAREGVAVSPWLAEAAAERLKLDDARAAVAQWREEHGPPSEEARRFADRVFHGGAEDDETRRRTDERRA